MRVIDSSKLASYNANEKSATQRRLTNDGTDSNRALVEKVSEVPRRGRPQFDRRIRRARLVPRSEWCRQDDQHKDPGRLPELLRRKNTQIGGRRQKEQHQKNFFSVVSAVKNGQ